MACIILLCGCGTEPAFDELHPLERHERLLEEFARRGKGSLSLLEQALYDENLFIRRTAAHLLVRTGLPAKKQLKTALDNDDFEVRIIALRGLGELELLANHLEKVFYDESSSVRRELIFYLEEYVCSEKRGSEVIIAELGRIYDEADDHMLQDVVKAVTMLPPEPRIRLLLFHISDNEDEKIRAAAYERLFEITGRDDDGREKVLLAALGDESMEIREKGFKFAFETGLPVEKILLPSEGWKFHLDREETGREKGWFKPEFKDSGWRDIGIEGFWHEYIGDMYVGAAWYRRSFDVPEFSVKAGMIYLHFGAVDSMGWVWVNGEYAGHADVGWDVPFHMDVSGLIKPGEENHIAVLAKNTGHAGGIWRPVYLSVLNHDMP